MPRIRFLVTRTVQDGSGTTFEAGQEYNLPDASAERWVRRGVAEPVVQPAPAPASNHFRPQRPADKPAAPPKPVAPPAG